MFMVSFRVLEHEHTRTTLFPSADNSVSSEKKNFLKEIEMMKNVSGGENSLRQFVVNMMGCVTVSEPMLLVLEFASHGDLQSYLRSIRKKVSILYRKSCNAYFWCASEVAENIIVIEE